MSMITDRIGWNEVLLPIDQNYDKIWILVIYFHLKKKTVNSMKCKTTVHAHDTFCPLAQAWHVSYPFNCPITLSNYKHVVYNVLLVGLVMMSDNFVIVLLTIIITYVLNRPEGVYDNSNNPRGDKHCLPSAGIHAATDQCFWSNSGWQQWTCFASKHNPIWSGKYTVTPLNSTSDQDRISPLSINTLSSRQLMRIKKDINQGVSSWSNTKFSELSS